jgi:glucose dehydrogenase
MIFTTGSNPSPDVDGSGRKGINLFTNSIIALDLATGTLKWYFQQLHHDIWDWDSSSPPILFDVQIFGQTIKAVAEPQKTGFLFMLHRETGQPIHPIIELPVTTQTDVPGEEVWPTQPFPFKANGQPMEPFRPLYPVGVPAENASRIRPFMTPPSVSTPYIQVSSAANFAPCSFSPQTGLVYVTSHDSVSAFVVLPVGATLMPGQGSLNWRTSPTGRPARGSVSAYDPITGELVWRARLPGPEQGGSVVTAGNVVFVGDSTGYFHAFDATTGEEMWNFFTGASIAASPMVYELNGQQYVAVASGGVGITGQLPGNLIVSFALPKQ